MGSSLHEVDNFKNTALMVAAQRGRLQNLKFLLADPVRYNHKAKNKEGNAAFHLAAMRGHLPILKEFRA